MKDYLLFDTKGFDDYLYWQKENRKITAKINALIKSSQREGPLNGIGKPEPLKGNYKGFYSRRIDEKNRLIYNVSTDNEAKRTLITSCCEHYPKMESQRQKSLLQGLHI